MQLRHFLYNCFVIEDGEHKIVIDPGQNLWLFRFRSLLPKEEWSSVTHVLVTHGDPDHYWQADRVAKAGGAPLIVNRSMIHSDGGTPRILAPRRGGMKFVPYEGRLRGLEVGDSVDVDGVRIDALPATHGPIEFELLGKKHRQAPGPDERVGFGATAFRIHVGGYSLLNLGDTVLLDEWDDLRPDVLMLPIGGLGDGTWTMDVPEAVEATRRIKPRLVVPCHYDVPFLWIKRMAVADDAQFAREVERLGVECEIMRGPQALDLGARLGGRGHPPGRHEAV